MRKNIQWFKKVCRKVTKMVLKRLLMDNNQLMVCNNMNIVNNVNNYHYLLRQQRFKNYLNK